MDQANRWKRKPKAINLSTKYKRKTNRFLASFCLLIKDKEVEWKGGPFYEEGEVDQRKPLSLFEVSFALTSKCPRCGNIGQ